MNVATDQPPADVTDADPLGVALLNGLARPFAAKQTPWVRRTIPTAILSFGVLPAIRLGVRFRQFVTLEQQQFVHLAEWVGKIQTTLGEGEAPAEPCAEWLGRGSAGASPSRAAEAMRYRKPVGLIVQLLAVLSLAVPAYFAARSAHPLRFFLDSTYLFPYRGHHVLPWLFWCGLLSAAYVLHLWQVRLHARDRERFIARLNDSLRVRGLEPIRPTPLGPPYRSWLMLAVVLLPIGCVWAIPMAFAASAHRRSIWRVSLHDRRAMARRVQVLLQRTRPEATLAAPVFLRPLCENEACRAPAPHWATYCPRCGDSKGAA